MATDLVFYQCRFVVVLCQGSRNVVSAQRFDPVLPISLTIYTK